MKVYWESGDGKCAGGCLDIAKKTKEELLWQRLDLLGEAMEELQNEAEYIIDELKKRGLWDKR